MVRTPIGQAVDQPGIPVVGEDDRAICGEQRVELGVRQPVRVLARGLEAHQVDDVDDADLDVGQVLPQQVDRGQRLQRRLSPQQAITTSGSPSWSLLAQSHMPMPRVRWRMAWSIVSQSSEGGPSWSPAGVGGGSMRNYGIWGSDGHGGLRVAIIGA